MVSTYIKVSISIKKEDEEEFNRFLDVAKEDPNFKKKNKKNDGNETKEVIEFIGVSAVFNKFWKFYLDKKKIKENKDEIQEKVVA